jgi:DNA-binding transcriptional regulator YdaS (Cro superfamily)
LLLTRVNTRCNIFPVLTVGVVMGLDEFLKVEGLTQEELAALYDPPITQGLVSHWIRGRTRMSLDYALQTVRITGGKVTPEDCAAMFNSED